MLQNETRVLLIPNHPKNYPIPGFKLYIHELYLKQTLFSLLHLDKSLKSLIYHILKLNKIGISNFSKLRHDSIEKRTLILRGLI